MTKPKSRPSDRRPGAVTRPRLARLRAEVERWASGGGAARNEPLPAQAVALLCLVWPYLGSGRRLTSMQPRKLRNRRIERPSWDPPRLSFWIERHGGPLVRGGLWELQQWTVDLDAFTVELTDTGARPRVASRPRGRRSVERATSELAPRAPRRSSREVTGSSVDELLEAVVTRAPHPAVTWSRGSGAAERVRFDPHRIAPGTSRTALRRRKRVARGLRRRMRELGWLQVNPPRGLTYERTGPADAASRPPIDGMTSVVG